MPSTMDCLILSIMPLMLATAYESSDVAVLALCIKLPEISNGIVNRSRDPVKAFVECNEGYIAKPNATIICRNRSWSEVQCVATDCHDVTQPENGIVSYLSHSRTFGSIVEFNCKVGYTLNGNSTLSCLTNGEWSGDVPLCTKTDCLRIDTEKTIKNGNITYDPPNSTTYNSVAHFACNPGYYLEESGNSTCLETGQWSLAVPECRKKCEPIGKLEDGDLKLSTNISLYQSGFEVHFSCNTGFSLQGSTFITCLSNGQWDGNIPACERVSLGTDESDSDDSVKHLYWLLAVVIAIAATGLALYIRKSGKVCLTKKINDADFDQLNIDVKVCNRFRPSAISRRGFPSYVEEMHKNNNHLFADGFLLLNEESPIHTTTVAENPVCKTKTRFSNILPFDDSRVKLLPINGEEGSDFINANFVPEYNSSKRYIAAQGPTPDTKNDFWRMIWEYHVDIIVMLTNGRGSFSSNHTAERQRAVPPDDQYWPDELQGPVPYGKLLVKTKSESALSDCVTRVMDITLAEESRTVTHIHFTIWPEHGCPKRYWPLLNFIIMVRQYLPRQMVVHCSNGVGRTGTYIALDKLLQHLNEHDDIDVYSVILDIRNFRSNMVETLEQFIFIHDCIKRFIILGEDEEDEEDDARQFLHKGNGIRPNYCNNHGFEKEMSSTTTPSRRSDFKESPLI